MLLESKLIEKILDSVKEGFDFVFSLPRRTYDYLDKIIWDKLVQKLGRPILGGEKIDNFSNVFYKRLIMSTFVFSLLFLPFFIHIRKERTRDLISDLAKFFKHRGNIFLFALPLAILEFVLDPGELGRRDFGGWSLFLYMIFFIYKRS